MAKWNKDTLMKVGIAAAVVIIVYLLYRSQKNKDTYSEYVPDAPMDDEYAENMFASDAADYAEEEDDYAEEEEEPPMTGEVENFTLMQSTLDDDEANAMFEPEM